MGDTDNITSAANARAIIINFFSNIQKREDLFKQIIEVLKIQDDFFYIYSDNEKLETFQDCIVDGHFEWILDVTNNQIQTEFSTKYTNECAATNKVYNDFYKIFDDVILNSDNFSERAKRLLYKYSKFLTE